MPASTQAPASSPKAAGLPTATGSQAATDAQQHQPTAFTRNIGLITCLVIAAMVAVMVVSGLIRASNRGDRFSEAQTELTEALEILPFTARLPETVPGGARLVGVIMQEPDDNRGPSIYAIETTYTVVEDRQANGGPARYIRVWQTNDVYLRKRVLDPLGDKPDPTAIAGNTWYRRDGESLERNAGVSYTTRFDDGITMVVSGPDEQLVIDTINALR
jgi:hypothetical protein